MSKTTGQKYPEVRESSSPRFLVLQAGGTYSEHQDLTLAFERAALSGGEVVVARAAVGEALSSQAFSILEELSKGERTRTQFLKNMGMRARDLDAVLSALLATGQIEVKQVTLGRGRPSTVIRRVR